MSPKLEISRELESMLGREFAIDVALHDAGSMLDRDILGTLWLDRDELAARSAEHRSPLVSLSVDDYLRGSPLDVSMSKTGRSSDRRSTAGTA